MVDVYSVARILIVVVIRMKLWGSMGAPLLRVFTLTAGRPCVHEMNMIPLYKWCQGNLKLVVLILLPE